MNQYYYNKQNKVQWMTAGVPFRHQSRMISACQVIGAIEQCNMHRAKDYNLEGTVKESNKKSNSMKIRVYLQAKPVNFQLFQTILN